MVASTPSSAFLLMINLTLRDPADLALIRKALMQLPRIEPDYQSAVMELLLHIHDHEELKPDPTTKLFF